MPLYTSLTRRGRKWPTLFLGCLALARRAAVRPPAPVRGPLDRRRPPLPRPPTSASSCTTGWGSSVPIAGRPRPPNGHRGPSAPPPPSTLGCTADVRRVADHLASRNRSSTSDSSPPAVQNKRINCPKNMKQVTSPIPRQEGLETFLKSLG